MEAAMNVTVVTPPFDAEAEAGALACVICGNGEAERMLNQLEESDLHEIKHKTIFRALLFLQEDGAPLNIVTLDQYLKDYFLADDAGGREYVSSLPDRTPSPANFPTYLATVRDRAARRRQIADADKAKRAALDLRTPILTGATISESLARRRFDSRRVPPPLRVVYSLAGHTIATPGNLVAISAHAKAGKSAAVSAIIASVMAGRSDVDTLSFASSNPAGFALVHFDTEQAPDDCWYGDDRALKRAGIEREPAWFFSYHLKGLSCREALAHVTEGLSEAAEKCGGLHSCLIDGIADLVPDVNKPDEANAFVSQLEGLAVRYDCPIIGVIHFNPGTEKTRGHLGSQFERKSETNLRLDKVGDVTTMWSDKQRRAPIPKESGPCFSWSDSAGMHVSCETLQRTKDAEKAETLQMLADDAFSERPSMRYADLVSTLKKTMRVSTATAERKVQEMAKFKIIKKSVAGLWTKSA